MHTAGYLGVYATLRGDVGFKNVPPLWRTGCVIALAANGNSFFDTAVLLASMNNFPTEKGTVAGLLKSYLGLSSAIFAQLYVTVAPPHNDDDASTPRPADGAAAAASGDDARARVFVLMIALVGGAVATLAAPFVREVGKPDGVGSSSVIVPVPTRRRRWRSSRRARSRWWDAPPPRRLSTTPLGRLNASSTSRSRALCSSRSHRRRWLCSRTVSFIYLFFIFVLVYMGNSTDVAFSLQGSCRAASPSPEARFVPSTGGGCGVPTGAPGHRAAVGGR